MPVTAKHRRRWFGALCLVASVAMLAAGETTPGKRLDGIWFILYWLWCFVLAALALLMAILDAGALRREARSEQRKLLEHALDVIETNAGQKSKANAADNSPPPTSGNKPAE